MISQPTGVGLRYRIIRRALVSIIVRMLDYSCIAISIIVNFGIGTATVLDLALIVV